jgi:serine/threonine protein kinase
VFQAVDVATKANVAIKLILRDGRSHEYWDGGTLPCMSEAAVMELRWTLALLGCRNVVAFDRVIVLTDFTTCFVMKLYTCTLYAAIKSGLMPMPRVRHVFRCIAEALVDAHARDICHRDVKSANILIDGASGDAVLADFGIARDGVESRSTFIALTGSVVTIGYAPVETLQHIGRYGLSIDVWALGVVLAEMCLGVAPFPPCKERTSHIPLLLRATGVPSERVRRFLSDECYVPGRVLDSCPTTSVLTDRLRTHGVPDAVVATASAMLELVPADRPTAQRVLDSIHAQWEGSSEASSSGGIDPYVALEVMAQYKPIEDVVWNRHPRVRKVSFLMEYEPRAQGIHAVTYTDIQTVTKPDTVSVTQSDLQTSPLEAADAVHEEMVDVSDTSGTSGTSGTSDVPYVSDAADVTGLTDDSSKDDAVLRKPFVTASERAVARRIVHALFLYEEDLQWHMEAWLLALELHAARSAVISARPASYVGVAACVTLAMACTRPAEGARSACRFTWLRTLHGHMAYLDVPYEETRVLRDLGTVVPRTPIPMWRRVCAELTCVADARKFFADAV